MKIDYSSFMFNKCEYCEQDVSGYLCGLLTVSNMVSSCSRERFLVMGIIIMIIIRIIRMRMVPGDGDTEEGEGCPHQAHH